MRELRTFGGVFAANAALSLVLKSRVRGVVTLFSIYLYVNFEKLYQQHAF
jgi:hypothetical protein